MSLICYTFCVYRHEPQKSNTKDLNAKQDNKVVQLSLYFEVTTVFCFCVTLVRFYGVQFLYVCFKSDVAARGVLKLFKSFVLVSSVTKRSKDGLPHIHLDK